MKALKIFVLPVFVLLQAAALKAQSTPEAFLAQLPSVPNSVCSVDTSVVNHFIHQVDKVKEAMQVVIDRFQNEAEADQEKTKNKALSKAAAQAGLSMNDMNQLQNENISEGQKNKIIDKSLGNQYNLSMAELSKVANMSEKEQQQWAQNYANQQMQKARENPKEAIKKQQKGDRIFELAKEQKEIGDRITAKMTNVNRLFKNVEQQDTIETRKLTEQLRPLEKQLCSGICSPAEIARSRAAEKQIYNLKLRYCEKMSPLQIDAISQYLTSVKTLFPDYRRLTEVQNEIVRLQTGVIVPADLSCYGAVGEYADVLSSAYKYWVGKFEQ